LESQRRLQHVQFLKQPNLSRPNQSKSHKTNANPNYPAAIGTLLKTLNHYITEKGGFVDDSIEAAGPGGVIFTLVLSRNHARPYLTS
jgi:hypothetical protein